MPTFEGTIEQKVQNLYDTILMYRKELDYLLQNLDEQNVLRAKTAEIAEIYAGTIEANKITVTDGKITTAQIEDLSVGGNVTMGPTATISWNNVTNQPDLSGGDQIYVGVTPPEDLSQLWLNPEALVATYTDQQAIDAIEGTFIDGTSVWTINVYAQNIIAGLLKLTEGMIVGTEDGSVSISKDGIVLTNGKIRIDNADGTSTMLDQYGIDPKFLDYAKNLIWNSSFELFDSSNVPLYWSGGTASNSASFNSTYSLKIPPSGFINQTTDAQINPSWYGRKKTRVSFYSKFGQVKAYVYDVTNSRFFTLTNTDGTTGTSLTFDRSDNWEDSRQSFSFDPDETDTSCVNYRVCFENIHATEDAYIDAVMAHVDFTGKWAQIYKDGQKSVGVSGKEQGIHISTTAPSDTSLLWLDIS